MKILIRRFFPSPSVDRWRCFEALMKECLGELGHQSMEMDLDPSLPPDPAEADFRIYSHKTRREVPQGNLFYKEMHMRGLFTVDERGWGADDSQLCTPPDLSSVSAGEAENFCRSMRSEFLASGRSKLEQPAMNAIPQSVKPYFFAPLQLPGDDVIMHHSPLTISQYMAALSQWADRRGRNVVFKLHPGVMPSDLEQEARQWAAASPNVFLLNENVHSLISAAHAVIVINSGVGFESLIHGKPVITLGACDYQWMTFRATVPDLDAAWDFASAFSEQQRLQGFRFIHYYYHQHAYLTSEEARARVKPRLMEYLEEHVRN
jgi:Capsule polysaccharide biosynthesis protein